MSSNIEVQRICQHCNEEFTTRTTVTKYCSETCANRAYKARKRAEKMRKSNVETTRIKTRSIEELKAKEFLTVRDVARLLNCSIRSVYYQIEGGTIKAVNLGQRMTRVKRSEIDNLFKQTDSDPDTKQPKPGSLNISDCYTMTGVQDKFGISDKALYDLIKRNNIPKIKKGRYAYVPKNIIDQYLK